MPPTPRPLLRPLEIYPLNNAQEQFVLRDPDGIGETVVLPLGAAVLASLMNGRRTLRDLQDGFQEQTGYPVALADVEHLVLQLDQHYFLQTERFQSYWREHVQGYLELEVRPAAHAGGAYEGEPELLRAQLGRLFTCPEGPGKPRSVPTKSDKGELCGVLSPHIDLHRGGPTFAWAYKRVVEESQADLFIVFGTAHSPMQNLFSVSRKHFATPLGVVPTEITFIDTLAAELDRIAGAGASQSLFEDEIAHRHEHSIEFQTVFLQYLLGPKRPFKIVPILTGSLHEFYEDGLEPIDDTQVRDFISALRQTVEQYPGQVCYISGGDLAHVGPRFGDSQQLTAARLRELRKDDHKLLGQACAADAEGFFTHVAECGDRNRICGLAPTYAMLQAMQPSYGELLRYDQAVDEDASSCVSFASLAFYK